MTSSIRVVYENGVLRPLEPVHLTEGEALTITIEDKDTTTERDSIRAALGDLVRWSNPDDDRDAWVEELADEIDRAFQGNPPLSQVIIEDRGEG